MKRTLQVGAKNMPILGWREKISEAGNLWHQCFAPLAVVGDVWEIKHSSRPDGDDVGLFLWNARVMDSAREGVDGRTPPRGYAATLEAAKAIVECILVNTGTCDPRKMATRDAQAANEAKIAALDKALDFACRRLESSTPTNTGDEVVLNSSTVIVNRLAIAEGRAALALART